MTTARVEQELPASIEQVWALLEDFSDMTPWANPGMSISRSEGAGVGALRWVETPQGQLVERCETYDPSAWTFSYSITEGPPNLERYLSTVSLRSVDARRSAITWGCDFALEGMEEAAAAQMIEGTYRGFIANLARSLSEAGA